MKEAVTGEIDLKNSQKTEPVLVSGVAQFSIQPVVSNLCGSPTYTLEVSNLKDDGTFIPYDITTTDITFDKSIQSDYDRFPWKYLRLSCNSDGRTDSGLVIFHISM